MEESQTLGDEVEFTEGLTIDRGFLSPYFISDQERSLCEFKNPKVWHGNELTSVGLIVIAEQVKLHNRPPADKRTKLIHQ